MIKKDKRIVWEFTNQKKLTKSEFIDYFERKIFRAIRKYDMLPKDKKIRLKKSDELNVNVLKHVLEKKFVVVFSKQPNFSSESLSQVAEDSFKNILRGEFGGGLPADRVKRPLYFLSDGEIEMYATLVGIRGTKRKKNKKIQLLFEKFLKKNQDLEHNIVGALSQLC